MTLAQLIAKYNELAPAAGLPVRKGFDNKSKAEAAIVHAAAVIAARPATQAQEPASLVPAQVEAPVPAAAAIKVRKARGPVKIREKGPRGFKFGPVWLESIRCGKGVALKPQNMPKLLETARFVGAHVTDDLSQAEIVSAVARAL